MPLHSSCDANGSIAIVTSPVLGSLVPDPLLTQTRHSYPLFARVYQNNQLQPNAPLEWESDNPNVLSVSDSGVVETTHNGGEANVTVRSGDLFTTTRVKVWNYDLPNTGTWNGAWQRTELWGYPTGTATMTMSSIDGNRSFTLTVFNDDLEPVNSYVLTRTTSSEWGPIGFEGSAGQGGVLFWLDDSGNLMDGYEWHWVYDSWAPNHRRREATDWYAFNRPQPWSSSAAARVPAATRARVETARRTSKSAARVPRP
jgi:hypothetical protein